MTDEDLLGNEWSPLLVDKQQSQQLIRYPRGNRTSATRKVVSFVLLGVILAVLVGLRPRPSITPRESPSSNLFPASYDTDNLQNVGPCDDILCFRPAKVAVPTGRRAFPSFWSYKGPTNVTYDSRSLMINGDRVLFLAGSMHPSRATKATWELALDEAVRNGLNMVTVYIVWAAHQPFPDREMDWRLTGQPKCEGSAAKCRWDLAGSIRAAANRGLFVHVRVGPYVCAEYNYGGIPEWVALNEPDIAMRRPNRIWMNKMKTFVNETVSYLSANRLWAYQGGPIIMAQIENELGGDVDASLEHLVKVDSEGRFIDEDREDTPVERTANLQDYADWCGALAYNLAPQVLWTMCNGLSAANTISTFNGDSGVSWLENHGDSGRIQIDQPAIWTEDEGGFQIWGDEPQHPSDYYWGRTARGMSYQALRWFARGGTHLNYYMFWGSYNRDRMSAAGIMNIYASDAPMCPSGQRRQPKYGHFQSLHEAMADIAPILLASDTALFQNETVKIRSKDGAWIEGSKQMIFRYKNPSTRTEDALDIDEVMFVENNANVSCTVKFQGKHKEAIVLAMKAYSSILLVDSAVQFDSASIKPRLESFKRKVLEDSVTLLDRTSRREPAGAFQPDPRTIESSRPQEQTTLMFDSGILSDYAWYETDFTCDTEVESATLFVDTQQANAIVAFINGVRVGSADTHRHAEGNVTLNIALGDLAKGSYHTLSLLSESLGYSNLIGRWGASTKAKLKGITGDVLLFSPQTGRNQSLVDGRTWRSFAGLHGERLSREDGLKAKYLAEYLRTGNSPCSWTSVSFDTPRYDPTMQTLFLDIVAGRGHLWLNGRDLGRYWNITRGETDELSQRYYFLPNDYLYTTGELNELVLFDVFGGDHSDTSLVLSWIEPSESSNFLDEVDYPLACI